MRMDMLRLVADRFVLFSKRNVQMPVQVWQPSRAPPTRSDLFCKAAGRVVKLLVSKLLPNHRDITQGYVSRLLPPLWRQNVTSATVV